MRRPPPEPFRWFVDECLGRHVVSAAIRAVLLPGETIETVERGTPDADWLPRAGEEGWICLTKDRRLLVHPNELEAFKSTRVRAFAVGGNLLGAEAARRFAEAMPAMRAAARELGPAFFVRIDGAGALSVRLEHSERVSPARRFKPRA